MGDAVKIQRVCVAKAMRLLGLDAALMRFVVANARDEGAARAVLGAQTDALGFYERLGFEAVGEVYDDAGIAHQDMVLQLTEG